jgi:hypothetical protein
VPHSIELWQPADLPVQQATEVIERSPGVSDFVVLLMRSCCTKRPIRTGATI